MTGEDLKEHLIEVFRPVVSAMTDCPEDVVLECLASDSTVVLSLKSHAQDRGKLIGKEGRTAQALRTLMHAICAKYKMKAVLEIVDR